MARFASKIESIRFLQNVSIARPSPDGKFVTSRVDEMESLSTGKLIRAVDDLPAGGPDRLGRCHEIIGIDNHQRQTRSASGPGVEAAYFRRAVDGAYAGIVRTVVVETPTEHLGIKRLRCPKIGGRQLDIVDRVMDLAHVHSMPALTSVKENDKRSIRDRVKPLALSPLQRVAAAPSFNRNVSGRRYP